MQTPDLYKTAGEVTLTGRVLPIGGVKEKTIAARRSGVKTLIFPKANQHDFEELSGAIKLCCSLVSISRVTAIVGLRAGPQCVHKIKRI